jgi:nitrite reductase/ring-hydroxylating ferredoxin subunit
MKSKAVLLGHRTSRSHHRYAQAGKWRDESVNARTKGAITVVTVQCLWHGSQFDVSTGKVKARPATKQIRVYQVKEEPGEVRLVL